MLTKEVIILTHAWNGDTPMRLSFPDKWDIEEQKMRGHDAKKIEISQIKKRLQNPIGTEALDKVAENHENCAIIVNDSCRPFDHSEIVPEVLKGLRLGGILDKNIRFVIGSGAHSWTTLDMIKKILGDSVPSQYLVFNHNCYENNVFVGTTSRRTVVKVNKEVMDCDLKISLHGIIPHELAGFGGGSKIILPGVSAIDTIAQNHRDLYDFCKGNVKDNEFLRDLDESAKLVGLNFVVNQIINGRRQCVDLVCGDVISAHRDGSEIAREHYVTKFVNDADIIIANSYPMDYEPYKALYSDLITVVNDDGCVVVFAYDPRGLRGHYLTGRFGKDYGSRMWNPSEINERVRRIIVVSPYHSLADEAEACGTNSIWVNSWDAAVELLNEDYTDPKVAVYPTASIQMSEREAYGN